MTMLDIDSLGLEAVEAAIEAPGISTHELLRLLERREDLVLNGPAPVSAPKPAAGPTSAKLAQWQSELTRIENSLPTLEGDELTEAITDVKVAEAHIQDLSLVAEFEAMSDDDLIRTREDHKIAEEIAQEQRKQLPENSARLARFDAERRDAVVQDAKVEREQQRRREAADKAKFIPQVVASETSRAVQSFYDEAMRHVEAAGVDVWVKVKAREQREKARTNPTELAPEFLAKLQASIVATMQKEEAEAIRRRAATGQSFAEARIDPNTGQILSLSDMARRELLGPRGGPVERGFYRELAYELAGTRWAEQSR